MDRQVLAIILSYHHPLSVLSHQSDRMTQIPFAIIMIPYLEITYFKFCYTTIVLDSILITKPIIVIISIIMDQESKNIKADPEITAKTWPTHLLSDLFRTSFGMLNPPQCSTTEGLSCFFFFKSKDKTVINPWTKQLSEPYFDRWEGLR